MSAVSYDPRDWHSRAMQLINASHRCQKLGYVTRPAANLIGAVTCLFALSTQTILLGKETLTLARGSVAYIKGFRNDVAIKGWVNSLYKTAIYAAFFIHLLVAIPLSVASGVFSEIILECQYRYELYTLEPLATQIKQFNQALKPSFEAEALEHLNFENRRLLYPEDHHSFEVLLNIFKKGMAYSQKYKDLKNTVHIKLNTLFNRSLDFLFNSEAFTRTRYLENIFTEDEECKTRRHETNIQGLRTTIHVTLLKEYEQIHNQAWVFVLGKIDNATKNVYLVRHEPRKLVFALTLCLFHLPKAQDEPDVGRILTLLNQWRALASIEVGHEREIQMVERILNFSQMFASIRRLLQLAKTDRLLNSPAAKTEIAFFEKVYEKL